MSTVVVVRKGNTAVIGADTLGKYGGTKQSADLVVNHSKIYRFSGNYIATTGSAAWSHILPAYLASLKPAPRLDSTAAIFAFATQMHAALKEKFYLNPKEDEKDEFESTQLDCLIANAHGIFGLYALRAVDEFSRYYAFGSGHPFALGAMHAAFGRGRTARQVARAGIEAAAEFDENTGLPAELHTIRLR